MFYFFLSLFEIIQFIVSKANEIKIYIISLNKY